MVILLCYVRKLYNMGNNEHLNFRSLAVLENIVHILCMPLEGIFRSIENMFVTKMIKLSNLYEFLINLLNYKKF